MSRHYDVLRTAIMDGAMKTEFGFVVVAAVAAVVK